MAHRTNYRILTGVLAVAAVTYAATTSTVLAEDPDSFALSKNAAGVVSVLPPRTGNSLKQNEPAPQSAEAYANAQEIGGVLRLCEIGGKRVRYSNLAIPGYQTCGELNVQRSCDPTGKRFFGPGSSPYSYLDCKRGPRIQISTDREVRAADPSSPPSGNIGDDLKALEGKRNELDALLDGSSDKEKNPPAKGVSRNTKSGLPSMTELPGGIPLDLSSVQKMLHLVQGRNQELQHLLE